MTHYLQPIDPAAAGFAADLSERLERGHAAGEFPGLHAVVVLRGGRLVLERYFPGEDEAWGRPLGQVAFGTETLHDLRSVSKSIVGLLYGIALYEGCVPGLEAPLVDQFPGLEDLAVQPARRALTVRHALTMTLGLQWNEDLPYTDPRNGEVAMEHAPDRIRYVLEQPIATAPGSRWCYCGGATALIAELLCRGTGRELLDYARERLLAPLGVTGAEWARGADGREAAASGMRLAPRDLARIGQLLLDGGRFGGEQIVPRAWLQASLTAQVRVDEEVEYGLQWWLGRLLGSGEPWYSANGNGGQRLFVAPALGVVVAVLCGNYNQPDHWRLPVAIISREVLGALRGA